MSADENNFDSFLDKIFFGNMVFRMIKIVSAHEPLPEGQTVTGYLVSRNKPSQGDVIDCRRATLTRIYSGHGVVRAETGVSPKKGFWYPDLQSRNLSQ